MSKEKWQTLIHKGPVFPKEHEVRGWPIKIKGQTVTFVNNPLADEMTFHWAAKLETDYVQDKTFQRNFWKDYKPVIKLSHDIEEASFPEDFDFTDYWVKIQREKEEKKGRSKEEKKREKEEKEKIKAEYGFADLDGETVPLGNYTVEPPGIFMGRGKHPLRGRWKPKIYPEDIIINCSKGQAPTPPEGHSWGRIEENKNLLATATWTEKMSGSPKKILFGASSSVKQKSDQKKFAKAIELANNFDKVNEFIDKKLQSRDKLTREIATVCKLISELSIRVGDEKGADTADTVGASSLRVEHISVDGLKVTFNFLGKDSIEYKNTVEFDVQTVRNIEEFMEGKAKGDQLFPNANSREVKDFLSIVMPGLTAKQFRTATGSTLLAKELKSKKINPNLSGPKKLEYFTEANLDVAIQLNHQSAVPKTYDESLGRMKDKLKEVKAELKKVKTEMKEELDQAKEDRDNRITVAKSKWKGQRKKEAIERANRAYDNKKERFDKKVARLEERIQSYKSKVTIKEKTKGIALGTSKLNYADPRIPISWCKDNDVDVKRIYPKTAQDKFSWAMDVDEEFYKKYPKID